MKHRRLSLPESLITQISTKQPQENIEINSCRSSKSYLKKYPISFQKSTSYKYFIQKKITRENFEKVFNKTKTGDYDVNIEFIKNGKVYDEFLKLINPEKPYINKLSPVKNKSQKNEKTKIELIPIEEYKNYLTDTMPHFRNTCFRIKKAKENIKVAKQLMHKYSY